MKRFRSGWLTLVAVFGLAAPGRALRLDPTFGAGGEVFSYANDVGGAAVVLQRDGKIVVVGSGTDNGGHNGVVLVRYDRSGAPDPTFGTGGIAASFVPPDSFTPTAMALQMDGKIVVTGGASTASVQGFFAARFLTNGSPDPAFGTAGFVTTGFPNGSATANALAIQADGKIVAVGRTGPAFPIPNDDFAAARYDSDGTLDASFGSGGVVVIDMGGHLPESVEGLVVAADGRIVLGGITDSPAGNGFALAALLADGSLDLSFGVAGKFFLSFGAGADCTALALQRDGKIVAAGGVNSPNGELVVRILPNGTLDATFGTDGVTVIQVSAEARAVAVDSLGRIVLAGSPDFVVTRLLPDGQPDTTVGPQGWLSAGLDGGAQHHADATSLALQRDGAIVLVGDQSAVTLTLVGVLRYTEGAATIPALSAAALLILATLLALVGTVATRRMV